MTGTPPTIPVDLTIRAAPRIMDEIGMNPQAALFGEVELAIIWEKVGRVSSFPLPCLYSFRSDHKSNLENGGLNMILPGVEALTSLKLLQCFVMQTN